MPSRDYQPETSQVSSQLRRDIIAEAIRQRRTIDKFEPQRPDDEILLKAIELACWAPNHKLTEPWRYYLLGPKAIASVVEMNAEKIAKRKGKTAGDKKRAKWSQVPGWLVVTMVRNSDTLRSQENYASVACAIQNLTLFLWEAGIGLKWTTGDITRDPDFYDVLGIKQKKETVVGLLWYGVPAHQPKSKRSPVEKFIQQLP